MVANQAIQALIQLMDDPDEHIYSHVKERLSIIGKSALPALEDSRVEENLGLLFQNRIENLIHEIHFNDVKENLIQWINSDEKDLLSGSLIIARYQYPYLNEDAIRSIFSHLTQLAWKEIQPMSTAFDKHAILNNVLFSQYKLGGNIKEYYSPLNSYLNTALELKSGTPLTLSIIYSIVANNLSIPIHGVNLPHHFVLAYMDNLGTNSALGKENDFGVLFYIDAFNKGQILLENDINNHLKAIQKEPNRACFEPCSNSDILKRMLNNLSIVYTKLNNKQKVIDIQQLKSLFE